MKRQLNIFPYYPFFRFQASKQLDKRYVITIERVRPNGIPTELPTWKWPRKLVLRYKGEDIGRDEVNNLNQLVKVAMQHRDAALIAKGRKPVFGPGWGNYSEF